MFGFVAGPGFVQGFFAAALATGEAPGRLRFGPQPPESIHVIGSRRWASWGFARERDGFGRGDAFLGNRECGRNGIRGGRIFKISQRLQHRQEPGGAHRVLGSRFDALHWDPGFADHTEARDTHRNTALGTTWGKAHEGLQESYKGFCRIGTVS